MSFQTTIEKLLSKLILIDLLQGVEGGGYLNDICVLANFNHDLAEERV